MNYILSILLVAVVAAIAYNFYLIFHGLKRNRRIGRFISNPESLLEAMRNDVLKRLTKDQKAKLEKEMRQASIAALKSYFLGDGARNRVIRFLGRFALYGTFWSIATTSMVIAALVCAVFVAPGHAHLLGQVRAMFVQWPTVKIDASVVSEMANVLQLGILMGFVTALLITLIPIIDPARKAVKEKWTAIARVDYFNSEPTG